MISPAHDDAYADYEAWKGWSSYFTFDAEDAAYFAGELRGVPLKDKTVLELGFGAGRFLAWARAQGAQLAGAEIGAQSIKEAERFGVELLDPTIETIAAAHAERFDIIAAFDLFEHFDVDTIRARLVAAETMLKPGGLLILRFPNGQSPFGLAPQHGDVTHRTALSKAKIEQLCADTTLTTVRYAGAHRIGGRGGKAVVRAARSLAQRLIGMVLSAVYGFGIPWDSMVVLVMRKGAAST